MFDGEAVDIGSRAFDLLLALIQSHGTVVGKDDLLRRVWPDMIVDEANLRVQLAKIRKALGDDRDLVKTVPRRGYLFAGEVTVAADDRAAAPVSSMGGTEGIVPIGDELTGNLPKRVSRLIGRSTELAALRRRIEAHRLITLVGPGGLGKTRLAIEVGRAMAESFPDGVWLIDLAPLTEAALVPGVAAALGIGLLRPDTAVATIAAALGTRRMLLIFDNCEHLIDAAGRLIEALLARAPSFSIVATSQAALRVPGEQLYQLAPLRIPPDEAADVMEFGAVALFVDRARAADRVFVLDRANRDAVVEICRRLDGVPLALEMAAARVPLLALGGLLDGLGERLRLLKSTREIEDGRYRTLREMVDWSYGLLDPSDQEAFRRLAVFAGSFSLDAAVAVIGPDRPDRWGAMDALGRLIDKSLIMVECNEPPYYRLLETLRLYAAERLTESGERESAAARHARYFAERAWQAYASWETAPEHEWLAPARLDLDNIRAALDWTLADAARAPEAIDLAGTAARIWLRLGLLMEGRHYAERALALLRPETAPTAAARLFKMVGGLWIVADRDRAREMLEQAEILYRRLGDRLDLAGVLSLQADIRAARGLLTEARELLYRAKELLAEAGARKSLFGIMNSLGMVATAMNEPAEARRCFGQALDVARHFRSASAESITLINLAELEFGEGDIEQAIDWGQEAVSRLRASGERPRLGTALYNLAAYLLVQDDLAVARPAAEEALALAREEGGFVLVVCLQQWALIGALETRHREAARLVGFVDQAFSATGETRQKTERQIRDRISDSLAAALSPASIRNCAAEGARWNEAQAVDYALDRLVTPIMAAALPRP